jgi:hypothetical protein
MTAQNNQNTATETLTSEERRWLESDPEFQKWDVRRKVLRIIDAQAARIDALEAKLVKALSEAQNGVGSHGYRACAAVENIEEILRG